MICDLKGTEAAGCCVLFTQVARPSAGWWFFGFTDVLCCPVVVTQDFLFLSTKIKSSLFRRGHGRPGNMRDFVLNISIYQGYQLIISNNNIKGVEAHCAEIFLILLCIFCCAPV